MPTSTAHIPIVLVTGFLGAGKTTFLNWIIEQASDVRCSFILNEFGDIKLESQFLHQQSESVIELANGCMCCVANSDIPRVVTLILEKSPQTQYILVEASGLSDPEPIVTVLRTPPLSRRVQLQQIVTLIDVAHFEKNIADHPIILSQIADADCIVLSKISTVAATQGEQVQQHIRQLVPLTPIVRMDDALQPSFFLQPSTEMTHVAEDTTHPHDHHAHDGYESLWLTTDVSVDEDVLRAWCEKVSPSLLRMKGVVCTAADQKWLVQSVQGTVEWQESTWQEHEPHQTAILCVGQALDASALRAGFAACVSNAV